MGYMNKVTLMGTVAKEVAVKKLERGSIASFRLGTVKTWKGKDGSPSEKKDWHNVFIADENIIQSTVKNLKMGDEVLVVGELANRKYTDKTGIEKMITEIKINPYDGGEIISLSRGGAATSTSDVRPAVSKQNDFDDCPF